MLRSILRWRMLAVAATVVVVGATGLSLLLVDRSSQPSVVVVDATPNDDPAAPFVFDPEIISIPVGSTIRWVNGSETFHTVTFSPSLSVRESDGTFSESMFAEGSIVERRFETAGTFSYFCQPHAAFMAGQIHVVDAG